ncbi:hypothetical protein SAMN06295987_10925 [Novosphingobium mathurense]|uniref:Uncharacterized protein n=1 Tax=Novosphingobium mathurense TaxID=428990 RepID=A0A1U6ILK2_9SPHN|nr:hypothetical protein SAMN06295987_10925 [Novosphingobium mathurense]
MLLPGSKRSRKVHQSWEPAAWMDGILFRDTVHLGYSSGSKQFVGRTKELIMNAVRWDTSK